MTEKTKSTQIYNGCEVSTMEIDGPINFNGNWYPRLIFYSFVLGKEAPFYSETRILTIKNEELLVRTNDLEGVVDREEAKGKTFEEHNKLFWRLRSIGVN